MANKLRKAVNSTIAIVIVLVLAISMMPAAARADSSGTIRLSANDDAYASASKAIKEHKTLIFDASKLSEAQLRGLKEFRSWWWVARFPLGVHSAKFTQTLIDRELTECKSWTISGYRTCTLKGCYGISAAKALKARKAITSCVKKAKKKKTKKAKIAYCYSWTMKKLKYDKRVRGGVMCTSEALLNGRGVCYHYAIVFAAALRELGIDARTVVATRGGVRHAIVKVGSKYYDPTWDDGKAKKKWKYFGVKKKVELKKGLRW